MAFKLDPSISLGDVGMALTLVAGGVLAFSALSARVDVHDERINALSATEAATQSTLSDHIQREASDREAVRQELRQDLKEINTKLDKLIDRELARPPGR